MTDYTCPICSSLDTERFIEIKQISVCSNLLYKTRQTAMNAPKADMRLGFCKKCGHIFNYVFDPDIIDYTQDYENSLHFSPRFQKYANELAYRLAEKYNLYYKDIIEIGCGDGYFLKRLCEIGNNRGVGFDPSRSAEKYSKTVDSSIVLINDFYSERYLSYNTDFICCRQVLEHIQSPIDFLRSIRRLIGNRLDLVVFFEVPNAFYTIKDLGIWDLIYEHCNYFTRNSLKELFSHQRFEVIGLRDDFGSQFLSIEVKPIKNKTVIKVDHRDEVERISDYVNAFSDSYYQTLNYWRDKLDIFEQKGKNVVVWGAGSKGVTFLNMMKMKDQIRHVVDISPRKQGKYLPSSGQEIIPPEALKKYRPDVVIVMNPVYLEEIRLMINHMGLTSQLIPV